jgi:hypothetical protein
MSNPAPDSAPEPRPDADAALAKRNGRTAWRIIGSLVFVGCALGVLAFAMFKDLQASVHDKQDQMEELGKTMTAEECVVDAIAWFNECDGTGPMCLQAVPMITYHCLHAKDRTEECEPMLLNPPAARWAFDRCKAQGIDKSSAKPLKKSCTSAYRALDSFCKTDQEGVNL